MGYHPNKFTFSGGLDAADLTVVGGFLCVVAGVALRYDWPLALIVFGVGVMAIGSVALWRSR